jgi:hypothetical protein
MTPSELHAGQNTLSLSRAICAPFIDMKELADMTLPPTVVVAPSVTWYRFITASLSFL